MKEVGLKWIPIVLFVPSIEHWVPYYRPAWHLKKAHTAHDQSNVSEHLLQLMNIKVGHVIIAKGKKRFAWLVKIEDRCKFNFNFVLSFEVGFQSSLGSFKQSIKLHVLRLKIICNEKLISLHFTYKLNLVLNDWNLSEAYRNLWVPVGLCRSLNEPEHIK